MKQKLLRIFMILTAIIGIEVATGSVEQVAHAKAKMTMKTFPKSIRGTWYSYEEHKMYRYKITSKKIVSNDFVARLHSRKVSYVVKDHPKMVHPSWVDGGMVTLGNKERWVTMRGWYQTAGDGSYYRKVIHKIGGSKHAVLQMAGGAGVWTDAHGYHSKKLAKKYAKHYYSGERKGDY